jgi:hypothetical protein
MHEYMGKYTLKDYILANRLWLNTNRSMKIQQIIFVALLCYNAYFVITGSANIIHWAIIVICLLWIAWPYTILQISVRAKYAKLKQKMHGETKIIFNAHKIIVQVSDGEDIVTRLHHHLVFDKMILLFFMPKLFIMLPRRFIGSDNEFEYAKQFLENFPEGEQSVG